MLPIFVGLIMAMLFGLFSFLVYGLEGLVHYAWIDTVFWSLIGTGVLVSLVNELGRCLACRLKSWVKIPHIESFCSEADCRSLLP